MAKVIKVLFFLLFSLTTLNSIAQNRETIRVVNVQYYNYEGKVCQGKIECNKAIAEDLEEIFAELFKAKYPIERIQPISEYDNDDETSMRHNNTSCYCYRNIKGVKRISKHALGMAIDINPLQNPCVRFDKKGGVRNIQPNTTEARENVNRDSHIPHQINRNDLCYKLFIKHGFHWGGAWRRTKDYQHFEK